MAKHKSANCSDCELLLINNPSYLANRCISCYNAKRRDEYKNDETLRKVMIERTINARKKNQEERRRIKLENMMIIENTIGQDNRICKTCEQIVSKTRFRKNRKACMECENLASKQRNHIVAARRLERLHTEPAFKFKQIQRNRILKFLQAKKNKTTNEYLGCSSEAFNRWLKYNSDVFTFENHNKLWHIDHVIPLSLFNLDNEDEQLIAFNWKNTSPLSISDNLKKGNKIITSQLRTHIEKLEKYHIANNIELPTEYIKLFARHLDDGKPVKLSLPPHNGNILGELG
jgi:hypothetical protein